VCVAAESSNISCTDSMHWSNILKIDFAHVYLLSICTVKWIFLML
jgi:hypothetical protein